MYVKGACANPVYVKNHVYPNQSKPASTTDVFVGHLTFWKPDIIVQFTLVYSGKSITLSQKDF
jgi:hypothetical protein